MDFYRLIGYGSGLLFIRPDMEPTSLWSTLALIHILDAILCGVVAKYSGRNKYLWTISGLICGIWALGLLFLMPAKKSIGT